MSICMHVCTYMYVCTHIFFVKFHAIKICLSILKVELIKSLLASSFFLVSDVMTWTRNKPRILFKGHFIESYIYVYICHIQRWFLSQLIR